jgi:peptidoglycan/xylan/chitin deacetylase (PgdA/CDA1 family)
VGTAGSFTVTATGFPTPTLSESGTLPSGVTLSTAGVLSGTPAAGTGGTYPITITASNGVTPNATQNFTLTVNNPAPFLSSISPNAVNAGADAGLTVTGAGFTSQSTVQLSGTSLVTTFGSSTQLTAVIPAAQLTSAGTLPVTVVTPSPGGGTSNAVDLTVLGAVAVIPSTRTLSVNQTEQFTATVAGISDQTVSWLVNDVSGGDATVGTVSATGIYIAPGAVPPPNTVIVKAVSAADPTKFGTAVVTVTLPASDNYPRPGAGSILRPVPSLPQIPVQGSAVAVLDWTAKDAYATQEDLLAVCHALSPSGIPHVHTTSVPDPSAYPFVAVAGVLDDLTNAERDALQAYVQNGGTLFLWRPSDGGLLARLGIAASYSHRGGVVRPLTFAVGTGDPALHYIDHDVEIHWQMKYPDSGSTRGYDPGTGLARAWWENGEAAVMRCDLGTGRAYVFGWRLRYVLTEAERLIVPGEEPPWTNAPILDADLCRLLLRGAYEGWATDARVRQFAPEGKPAALIVTHDVDAQVSYERIPEFAQLESERGFKATFNITTMPYNNEWTGTMYDVAGMQDIQAALDLGHDVQSHSFGHFPDFDQAPFGSGTETAENYMPRYSWNLNSTVGMSVQGELGVSRWLLENDFGITVEGFRSGYLLIPDAFLEGLRQTGYRHDSTYAGGVTRGYFPFALFSVSNGTVTTYPLVEYPMAIEDPTYLSEETLTQVVDAWEQVIRINYANNAPTVLNLHPVSTLRRQALEAILDRVSDLDLWIGDWKTFAEFWEAQGVTCDRWP